MAREQKQGLDYFSHDVDYDSKLEIIIEMFGEKGHGIINRIWQHIYKTNGYYIEYCDDELFMIKRKCSDASKQEIEEIIEAMVNKNLFSKKLFDKYKILTSKRLQSNYIQGTKRRVNATILDTYCLHIDNNVLEETTQSKVKNIRLNKTISNNSILNESKVMAATELISQEFKRLLTPAETKDIINLFNDLDPNQEEIENATLISIQRRVLNIAYIRGIIEKDRDGFKVVNPPSLEEALGGKL